MLYRIKKFFLVFKNLHFFHNWGVWNTLVNESYGFSYWRLIQYRKCLKCNKVQISNKIIGF